MRILIVDDEPAIRFSLAELLESEGHQVTVAEHAPAALAAPDGQAADLVISDLSMPAMDGMQLLEEVRARHPHTFFGRSGRSPLGDRPLGLDAIGCVALYRAVHDRFVRLGAGRARPPRRRPPSPRGRGAAIRPPHRHRAAGSRAPPPHPVTCAS
jgi:hypothetical protein